MIFANTDKESSRLHSTVDQLFMYHVRALAWRMVSRASLKLALARSHARMCIHARPSLNFRGSYIRSSGPIREKREILHHAKISHYTVPWLAGW